GPATVIRSRSGSACAPGSRRTSPFTVTRPEARSASAPRRDVRPARFRILLRRIGGSGQLVRARGTFSLRGDFGFRDDELAFDLGKVAQVAKPERDEKLARGLVQKRASRRVSPAGDPDHPPLQKVVEDAFGIHAADRVD